MNIPIPINAPSRKELWRRVRLAESILNHRVLMPTDTVELLRRVLRGEDTTQPPRSGEVG